MFRAPASEPRAADLRAEAPDRQVRAAKLAAARLYLVCDSRPGGGDLERVLRQAIAGGVDIVQLREKRLPDDELLAAARLGAAVCRDARALFVVNDRPDIAVRADADGVHVGQDDMPAEQARKIVGADRIVGLSTHAPSEVDDAAGTAGTAGTAGSGVVATRARVDYIGVGPVHQTPTKPGRPAVGLKLVAYAARNATLPFFAIGGIDRHNVDDVLAAGASRICVLRAIADAPDPMAAAAALRARLSA